MTGPEIALVVVLTVVAVLALALLLWAVRRLALLAVQVRGAEQRAAYLQGELAAAAAAADASVEEPSPPAPDLVDGLLRERLLERLVATLLSGETFEGALRHVDERTVVFVDTEALGKDGQRLPVDGELILRRDSLAYLQRP